EGTSRAVSALEAQGGELLRLSALLRGLGRDHLVLRTEAELAADLATLTRRLVQVERILGGDRMAVDLQGKMHDAREALAKAKAGNAESIDAARAKINA